ncbi:unnamed protein product [Effrenium voratum]|nr:unnamed protein product [Effrenium voratum]
MAPRAGSRLAEALKAGQVLKKEEIHQLFGAEGASVLYASVKATADGEVEGQELLQWLYKEDGTSSIPLEGELTSPRHTEQEIEKLGGLMELSASQEAVEEFKAMAKNLAREFKEKVAHPNAEAFIEQLCVEKILKGALFVGHVKTDLDSVAGAIGGACLYQGTACRAERELNGEIMYALRWAGLEMPPYFDDLPGAMEPDAEGNLKSICLVDHNEDKQMVPSLRDAKDRKKRIIGLIDHHALAESMASEKPLFMDVRPWGSMSSIVAHAFIRGNRMIPKPVARILLAAILSDTLNLQSVTTTNADRFLVTVLCILGECEDPDQLARAMFRAKTEWIVNLGAYEMTRGDQKDFTASGWKVGIAVLEVTDTCPVLKVAEELLMELRILKVEKGQLQEGKHDRRKELDFAYLFVVDVTKQESFLLIAGGRELALAKEAFPGKRLREAKASRPSRPSRESRVVVWGVWGVQCGGLGILGKNSVKVLRTFPGLSHSRLPGRHLGARRHHPGRRDPVPRKHSSMGCTRPGQGPFSVPSEHPWLLFGAQRISVSPQLLQVVTLQNWLAPTLQSCSPRARAHTEEQDIFARSRFNLGLPIFHTAKVAIPMATSSLGRGFPWKENGLGLLATCQLCLAHPQSRLPTKEGLSWSLGQHSCASCRSVQVCRLDALTRSPARTLLVRHRYGLHCFSKWGRRVVLSTFTQLYTGRGGLASDTDTGLSGCVGSKQV